MRDRKFLQPLLGLSAIGAHELDDVDEPNFPVNRIRRAVVIVSVGTGRRADDQAENLLF